MLPVEASQVHDPANRRIRGRTGTVVGVLLLAVVVALPVYYFLRTGGPLWDEWQCSQGEAPYSMAGGGAACWPEGKALPNKGDTWDPLGNRPLSCDDRRGWTQIRHTDGSTDCLRDGLALPDGWQPMS